MILAIDPGGATGIAMLGRDGVLGTYTIEGGFEGMSDWLAMKTWKWDALDAVVVENFIPRPGAKSQQLDALHIIGVVKHICRQKGIPLTIQQPVQAKSFATNDKLKAVGWYAIGADHERDAARHLLVFMCNGQIPAEYVTLSGTLLGTLVSA